MAGSVTPYETAKGRRWRARYEKPNNGGWTDKRGFETKREATLFLASVTMAKANGEYLDPSEGRRTVATFAEQWKSGRLARLKPSSRNVMESAWRLHVEPTWGRRGVAGIRASEVEDWVTGLAAKPLGAQSIRRAIFVLSSVLAIAQRDGIIRSLPTANIDLPAKPKKAIRFLTHRQVDILAESSAHPDLLLFLAYTGLRWGEAAALKVAHLDMLRRRIHVEENVVLVRGVFETGTPKSGERREVPMPVFLVEPLARICEGKTRDSYLWSDRSIPMSYPNGSDRWFAAAVRRAQAVDPTIPTITPHDLRHTAASLAVQAGANVKAVQRMLGHASAAMTLDVYADLFDEDLDAVASRMADARDASLARSTGQ